MRRSFIWGLLLVSALPAYSQLFSIGVKAGVPLTDGLDGQSATAATVTTSTDRWIVGPTAEIRLPFRLSFEVDALYRREGYTITQLYNSNNGTISNWQIPFLGKYELHGGLLRPFVDAGVTYHHLSTDTYLANADSAGFTIGGGIMAKFLFLRLSPEFRYTHFGDGPDTGGPSLRAAANQADFLVGFTF